MGKLARKKRVNPLTYAFTVERVYVHAYTSKFG